MLNSNKFTLGFLFWMALITFLSLYNFSDYHGVDIGIPFMDKAVHLIFYTVATILACLFIREQSRGKIPLRSALIYSAIFSVFYGGVIEVLQTFFTNGRTGEAMDFVANLGGIILALIIVRKSFSPNSRLKWKY